MFRGIEDMPGVSPFQTATRATLPHHSNFLYIQSNVISPYRHKPLHCLGTVVVVFLSAVPLVLRYPLITARLSLYRTNFTAEAAPQGRM